MNYPLYPCGAECPIENVPKTRIPYCPFSFYDLALELDTFLATIMPEYNRLVDHPYLTPAQFNAVFAYLNPRIETFLQQNPYPGFEKIYTIVRTDGVVVTDKIASSPDTYMIVCNGNGQTFTDILASPQLNTAGATPPIPPVSPIITPVQYTPTVKYFPSTQQYQLFDSLTTREEFMTANTGVYGWSARTGIYVTGRIFCLAKKITFSNANSIFHRLVYLRQS